MRRAGARKKVEHIGHDGCCSRDETASARYTVKHCLISNVNMYKEKETVSQVQSCAVAKSMIHSGKSLSCLRLEIWLGRLLGGQAYFLNQRFARMIPCVRLLQTGRLHCEDVERSMFLSVS